LSITSIYGHANLPVQERNALNVLEDRPGGAGRALAERIEEPAGLAEPRNGAGPDPKEALVQQRDEIRRAAQEGMSLKAAQLELNGTYPPYGARQHLLNLSKKSRAGTVSGRKNESFAKQKQIVSS
jgi:hypothetical protein